MIQASFMRFQRGKKLKKNVINEVEMLPGLKNGNYK